MPEITNTETRIMQQTYNLTVNNDLWFQLFKKNHRRPNDFDFQTIAKHWFWF